VVEYIWSSKKFLRSNRAVNAIRALQRRHADKPHSAAPVRAQHSLTGTGGQGAERNDPPLHLLLIACNSSCRLSEMAEIVSTPMRRGGGPCSVQAVIRLSTQPGVARNRFRMFVWLVIQKKNRPYTQIPNV
jgi:hypothetical protein